MMTYKQEFIEVLKNGSQIKLDKDKVHVINGVGISKEITPQNCKFLTEGFCQKHHKSVGSASAFECRFGLFSCWEDES